jgi:type II secretory pathway component PulF
MNTPNPYKAPRTIDLETRSPPRSQVLFIAYWVMFIASLTFPVCAVYVIPAFMDVFEAFGADLPPLTQLIVNYRFALFVLPFVALVPAVLISFGGMHKQRIHVAYKAGFVLLLLALCCLAFTVVLAMYLPIFRIAQVV